MRWESGIEEEENTGRKKSEILKRMKKIMRIKDGAYTGRKKGKKKKNCTLDAPERMYEGKSETRGPKTRKGNTSSQGLGICHSMSMFYQWAQE